MARVNDVRAISGVNPVEEQKPPVCPDLLIIKDNVEYGCGECGKDDVAGISKKESVERRLHAPEIQWPLDITDSSVDGKIKHSVRYIDQSAIAIGDFNG